MTTPNNKPSSDSSRQLNQLTKPKESLSFATWVLLIISFTLLAYAIYSIQTRVVLDAPAETSDRGSDVAQIQ